MTELVIEDTEDEEFELLPLNQSYTVEVQDYNIVDSSFKDKAGDPRKDIKWTLVIKKPDQFNDRVLVFWTPLKLTKNKNTHEPNKTLRFLQYLGMPESEEGNKKVNLDDFVGKKIQITLKNNKGAGGKTFQKIDNFFPVSQ